jgi:hypothetical protein
VSEVQVREGEKLSLSEAARILNRSTKAVEQLVHRQRLRVKRDRDAEGKTVRVWTTREWIDEYASQARPVARPEPTSPSSEAARMIMERSIRESHAGTREGRVIDELVRENVDLRLQVADLEIQLDECNKTVESLRFDQD